MDLALNEHEFPDVWYEQEEARPNARQNVQLNARPSTQLPPPRAYRGRLYPGNGAPVQVLAEHPAPPDPNRLAPPGKPYPISPQLERARLRAQDLAEGEARRKTQRLEYQRHFQEAQEGMGLRMPERRQAQQAAQAHNAAQGLVAQHANLLNQPHGTAKRTGKEARELLQRLNSHLNRRRPAEQHVVQPRVHPDDYLFQINQLDDAMERVARERAELDVMLGAEANKVRLLPSHLHLLSKT